ncbi:hypothetical protein KIN20_012361 [Parelaphostrongylus tenuis]|uniref:Uncharacterized protein n=1 Tax=Parelaphostrongylus tenuis TaxID=148309 RepID=A0AAD5QQE4_PARTN|nr:hypothetical protein KIN20_012361 [Parelaphostrongylus tenuis]
MAVASRKRKADDLSDDDKSIVFYKRLWEQRFHGALKSINPTNQDEAENVMSLFVPRTPESGPIVGVKTRARARRSSLQQSQKPRS